MTLSGMRGALLLTAVVLAGFVLSASLPHRPVTAPTPVTAVADAASAVAAANRQGSPVEVTGQRTRTNRVFANPGGSMTTEISAVPVRVKRGDAWLPIDTNLTRRVDGSVAPVAADGDPEFSGGGSSALATMRRDGHTLALHWPAPLPRPDLDGATATYRDVLPGIDLVMRAERTGYQQHLVVRTAAAGKNPALAAIRMRIGSDLTVRVDATGLRAVDGSGTEVFVAPPTTMWDATGRTVRFPATVDGATLVLAPDTAFLADPATTYPVTVDPAFTTFERQAWGTVLSGKPGETYWWKSADPAHPDWAQVGQCWNVDRKCNGIGEGWAYFQFDTSFLHDKTISEVRLNTTVAYSPSCTASPHQLYGSRSVIGPNLNWDNRPLGDLLANFTAPTSCGGAHGVGFDIGRNLNPAGLTAYSIRAANGGDEDAWRKYMSTETKLTVRWNRAPGAPTQLRTDPPLPAPCTWCGGVPYVADAGIRFIGNIGDPDNDQVDPQFEINWLRSDNSVESTQTRGWGLGFTPSGDPRSEFLDLTNQHGKRIGWRLRAGDGSPDVGPWADGPGPFVVDRQGITAEPTVTSREYPEDDDWHGGVGVPGTFTFGPGGPCDARNTYGTCDIDHYLYGWSDGSMTSVAANALGGTATVRLSPPGDGPRTLHVQSVDRAGHRTTATKHHITRVRAGNGPLAQWSFEGNGADTAFLGDRHGMVTGAIYGAGAVGVALRPDGGAASGMTAPAAVRTDTAFSVAAWVRLDHLDTSGVVVEQRGTQDAGFTLRFDASQDAWVFELPGADVPPASQTTSRQVVSSVKASAGVWTHLAATYEIRTRTMALYVNGEKVGTAVRQGVWNATGAVRVGRSWAGMVDEVQLYDRTLNLTEVRSNVGRDDVRAAEWKFDDDTGSTAVNAVNDGDAGILTNGAAFTGNGAVGGAVALDGVDDHVVTGRPVVRTDRSFTVTALVRADPSVPADRVMTAVSQDGLRNNGFHLQYASGKWSFGMHPTDSDASAGGRVAATATEAAGGRWTHLTGVYDATTRKISLYVDGRFGGEATLPVGAVDAAGPVNIGRAKVAGAFAEYWKGSIDEVALYSRMLSPAELEGIISRTDVPAGSWKLDGVATDDSVYGLHGKLVGDPVFASGQSEYPDPADLAVSLDGVDDAVEMPPVVDTAKSFSVAAWVRLGQRDATRSYVAVSQSGIQTQAFSLGYSGADDRWVFQMNGNDADPPSRTTRVLSGGAAQIGVWVHLAAVYHAASGEMRLYVNGQSSNSGQFVAGFNGASEFTVGRTKAKGKAANYFTGAVDDVRAYGRPLFADEIRAMALRELPLVHHWRFDEPSGSRAADGVGSRDATLTGGITRTPGRIGNAVTFTGNGAVSTTAVDIPTNDRFTVSAWVKLDRPAGCVSVCRSTAVSVDGGSGTSTSKFRLGHRIDEDQAQLPNGKWIFEMPEPNGTVTEAAISTRDGQFDTWVLLVGVYDAPAGKLWLYVYTEGNAQPDFDSGTLTTPWSATGGLRVGGGVRNGQAADPWRGSVDDVRLFTGAVRVERLTKMFRSYPAVTPSPTAPLPVKGHWTFDENSGTTAADSSGLGRTVTLRNGGGWNGGRIGATAWFDGANGYAQTDGPVVDTDPTGNPIGFSVSAWAHLTNAGGTVNRTVIGQDGDAVSAFVVQYRPVERKWAVVVPKSDASDAETVTVLSTEAVALSPWTHVAVTYDSQLGQIRLYINGMLSAAQTGVFPIASTGPLSIGRGLRNSANAQFWPGGIDDVRVFARPLSDGEVRRVHDDAPAMGHGHWAFDGTVSDSSWRNNPTTASTTGTSFTTGVRGQALQLDGTGSATTRDSGVSMTDTFTVSAWANLTRTDLDATIVSQDGGRMSAFMLGYRKNVGWIFGAATQDSDNAPIVYASSAQIPTPYVWTHLTGVYDYPARELRLYVDGQLAQVRQDAPLWPAGNVLVMGRGKYNGQPSSFFTGFVDDVRIDYWELPENELARRGSFPAPSGGHLGRFTDGRRQHTINSSGPYTAPFAGIPAGYRLVTSLGQLLPTEQAGTRRLYGCSNGADVYASVDVTCAGTTKVSDLGWAYTSAPTGIPTVALYACRSTTVRFDSNDPTCDGLTRVDTQPMGYAIAYVPLTRYTDREPRDDHAATFTVMPSYERAGFLGMLATTAVTGTRLLYACRDGFDQFATTDATCAGYTLVGGLGWLWTEPPPGLPSQALYECQRGYGDRFTTVDPSCEGAAALGRLGYVITGY